MVRATREPEHRGAPFRPHVAKPAPPTHCSRRGRTG